LIVFGSIFVLFCLFWIWRYFRNAQLVAHQWDDVPGGNTIAGRQEWVTRKGALRNDAAGSIIGSAEISVIMHDGTQLVEKSMCAFPSGKWKGYYYQYGMDHGLLPFQFNFEGMRVTAQGSDDVGDYSIEGVYNNETLRIAFGKTYKLGTGNSHENKGHTVEYRGMRNQNAAQGIQGTWYVRANTHYGLGYCGNGGFSLWPAMNMSKWNPSPPQYIEPPPPVYEPSPPPPPPPEGTPPAPQPPWPPPPPPWQPVKNPAPPPALWKNPPLGTYVMNDNKKCVICVERNIEVQSYSCGHMCMCTQCGVDLMKNGGKRCPICNAKIEQLQV